MYSASYRYLHIYSESASYLSNLDRSYPFKVISDPDSMFHVIFSSLLWKELFQILIQPSPLAWVKLGALTNGDVIDAAVGDSAASPPDPAGPGSHVVHPPVFLLFFNPGKMYSGSDLPNFSRSGSCTFKSIPNPHRIPSKSFRIPLSVPVPSL